MTQTQTQPHSTRWSPTPEQLMLLEEMYRNGVRTPNSSQIQQITAQLARYGRIQGKNVFYWFQNHKARERQKVRRWLSRLYGGSYGYGYGYAGGRAAGNDLGNGYGQLHPLTGMMFTPAAQFPLQPVGSQDGMFVAANDLHNASHGIDRAMLDDAADDPNFCYICSKLSQGFSEESVTHEWMVMMGLDSPIKQCRGPIRTLELFPPNHALYTGGPNSAESCHQAQLIIPPS